MKFNKLMMAALLVGAGFSAQAAEDAPKGITGAAEFGMVLTSGNTKNTTTTGKFSVSNDLKKWLHLFKLDVVSAEADGVSTAERYLLNLKSDYKLDGDQFLFAAFTYDVDKFSGFDSQTTMVAGLGRKLYDSEAFQLSAEVGLGYRVSEFAAGGDESEGIIHLATKGQYTVNDVSHLVGEITVDSGSNQTISIVDFGYVNKLNNTLALKVGFNIKNSSDVPTGTENTDTITSVSLLYSF